MTSEEIKQTLRDKYGSLSAAAARYGTTVYQVSGIIRKCSRSRWIEDLIAKDCERSPADLFEWRASEKVAPVEKSPAA